MFSVTATGYSILEIKVSSDVYLLLTYPLTAWYNHCVVDNVLLILDNTKTIRDALDKSPDKQDEEHRVWYVGVTRTKQNLYIMAAKKEDQGYDIESLG